MICQKCYNEFEGSFCPSCGTPAPQVQKKRASVFYNPHSSSAMPNTRRSDYSPGFTPSPITVNNKKRKWIWITAGAGFLAIAAAVLVILLIFNQKEEVVPPKKPKVEVKILDMVETYYYNINFLVPEAWEMEDAENEMAEKTYTFSKGGIFQFQAIHGMPDQAVYDAISNNYLPYGYQFEYEKPLEESEVQGNIYSCEYTKQDGGKTAYHCRLVTTTIQDDTYYFFIRMPEKEKELYIANIEHMIQSIKLQDEAMTPPEVTELVEHEPFTTINARLPLARSVTEKFPGYQTLTIELPAQGNSELEQSTAFIANVEEVLRLFHEKKLESYQMLIVKCKLEDSVIACVTYEKNFTYNSYILPETYRHPMEMAQDSNAYVKSMSELGALKPE